MSSQSVSSKIWRARATSRHSPASTWPPTMSQQPGRSRRPRNVDARTHDPLNRGSTLRPRAVVLRTPTVAAGPRSSVMSREHVSLLIQLVGVGSEAARNVPVRQLREALVAGVCFPLDEVGKET